MKKLMLKEQQPKKSSCAFILAFQKAGKLALYCAIEFIIS